MNADDAIGDRPGGRIRLVLDETGDEAVLRIIDNGAGIPDEIRREIWQPFYSTKGQGGNGMGLDISRRLVELHQGSINCESSGENTTFEVRLPLAAAQPQSDPAQQPVRQAPVSLQHV
jgi:signal transduction histidine kinase